ncbi:hypothetical protein SORBI_3006G212400 [Sorghum bicolor]|uniref:Right handed beta helix domain-containing protein n=1 Tax=Sorghum bicolor TaxID=4558 RepID=A0A1Z5RFM7_SORBI|nr:hypothetical protein SORBI_3006G212400 [Sorghum bicolor]
MEPAPGRRGRCLPLLLLLGALVLALAGGATAAAWPHPHGHGGSVGLAAAADGAGMARTAGGERWYRDLALRRMESVRSSFGARRDLATIHSGSLRASDDFPTDRYLIELSATKSGRSYDYEYATLRDLMLDCSYRGGGVTVVDSLRVAIDNCYVAHFASDGVAVRGGHETFIRNTFLGQHMTAGGDPGERGFTGTGIRLDGNDNSVSDVVIFSAATGIMVTAPANSISGVHCYNKATGFGGTGIHLKIPGLTQAWISNCYMDYTSIVAEDPVLLHVSGSFFLGDANVVLKAVNGVARGVQVVGNIFSGRDKGVDIVQLDGKFTTVDQVYVQQNSATGMTIKSTSARASADGNGSSWTLDFSPVLLFPDRIGHVQYSLVAGDEFPSHTLRNVSGNQVVVATDKAVSATVHVLVDQNSD